jgi:hypothetical protein
VTSGGRQRRQTTEAVLQALSSRCAPVCTRACPCPLHCPVCSRTAEAIEAKKGDLTIRAMLRHDDPALLEKLRHQPLVRFVKLKV